MKARISALALALVVLAAAAGAAHAEPLYVALGDSISRGHGAPAGKGFVDLYFAHLQTPENGGVNELFNVSVPGETSSSMLAASGQLEEGIAVIGEPSDTKVVTLDIGGNDALSGQCAGGFHDPGCPFRANYTQIVQSLGTALAQDPGEERFQVMQYYNPASGTGSGTETIYDFGLLGADRQLDCAASGNALGLNDLIGCIGRDHGAGAVDPYGTFKAVGQALMADPIHPNEHGHAAIACLFEHPDRAGSDSPCERAPLPPVTVEPPLDQIAPVATVSGARRQRILRRRAVSVVVGLNEAATVRVAGRVRIPQRRGVVARFRPVTKEVAAASATRFKLRLGKRGMTLVRRALRAGRKLTARITVRSTDAAGNSAVDPYRVRLVR